MQCERALAVAASLQIRPTHRYKSVVQPQIFTSGFRVAKQNSRWWQRFRWPPWAEPPFCFFSQENSKSVRCMGSYVPPTNEETVCWWAAWPVVWSLIQKRPKRTCKRVLAVFLSNYVSWSSSVPFSRALICRGVLFVGCIGMKNEHRTAAFQLLIGVIKFGCANTLT